MTWVHDKPHWGQIVNGELVKPCAFIDASEVPGASGVVVGAGPCEPAEPPLKKTKTSLGGETLGPTAAAPAMEAELPVVEASGEKSIPGPAPVESASSSSSSSVVPDIAAALATLTSLDRDCEQFWKLEEVFAAHVHGRNEDYNLNRIKKGEKPISFVLVAADVVENPVLAARFEARRRIVLDARGAKEGRERHAFHGTHPARLKSLCDRGLLPFGHSSNPAKAPVDSGYFGSCKKGIYVSRYADYTLKYANRLIPLRPGERCRIVLFRCVPGSSRHIESKCGPIDPTEGFDSHSSPEFLEWFLFYPDQCCPSHVLTIEAREDTRTAADDS